MRELPLSIGTFHFVGIGGIGMSGIAEVMHTLGYGVQGSDMAENANVKRLRGLGIKVAVGHDAANLGEARAVVISSAVKPSNPEVQEARARLLPVVRRAEMLAELMRLRWSIAVAGTHGKTTTTSLIAALLDAAGEDPTVINGGIINAYGSNARLGKGEWMVVEADESDGTFTKLPATIGVITNIDPEHLDHYGSFDALRDAFRTFLEQIPFYGFASVCIDHPEVQALIPRVPDRRLITYGLSPQADVRALDLRPGIEGTVFDVEIHDRVSGTTHRLDDLFVAMHGKHNVLNALNTLVIAREMKLSDAVVRQALRTFAGVKRRFTVTGVSRGVTVVDDYGHHPVEIAAVLNAARAVSKGRVIAVVQPHRYSRLHDLFEQFCTCFNDADKVVVAPVYAAGEEPLPGFDRDALAAGLRHHGHRAVDVVDDADALAPLLRPYVREHDLIVCLGAGSISQWAQALPAALDKEAVA